MAIDLQKQLELHLKELRKHQAHFFELSKLIIKLLQRQETNNSLKTCLISMLKRSISTIEGFGVLLDNQNFTCAAPLTRVYLDNLIRLQAFILVDDPNDIAMNLLNGKHIKSQKDKNGKLMKDWYLVESLKKEFDWVESVYKQTSGYIHFSEIAYFDTIVKKEENENGETYITHIISKNDPHVKIGSWLETTTLMNAVSKQILNNITALLKVDLDEYIANEEKE